MNVLKIIDQNNLPFRLSVVEREDLLLLTETVTNIFSIDDGIITLKIPQNSPLSDKQKEQLDKIPIYTEREGKKKLIKHYKDQLLRHSRSLSMGDPQSNLARTVSYLLINLHYLYQYPEDDDLLNNEYNCLKNMVKILIEQNYSSSLFQKVGLLPFHYSISHPLLSSLFILEYAKELKSFGRNDLENLFITNFFKDIGMSFLSKTSLNSIRLTSSEKTMIGQHEEKSLNILEGRLPLQSHHFRIIKNHHTHSILNPNNSSSQKNIFGFETVMVSTGDSFISMIKGRPYRKKISFFDALQKGSQLMGKEHHQEFKLLIKFVQKFFSPIS